MDGGLIPVLVSVLALGISFWTMICQKKSQNQERVHALTDRLYSLDEFIIQNPRVQKILYQHVGRKTPFFDAETPHDEDYFQVKSFIYFYLNLFDEIFCTVAGNRDLERTFEFDDWKGYIIRKMRHPLFRELYNKESLIWGEKFRAFCADNWGPICQKPDEEMF